MQTTRFGLTLIASATLILSSCSNDDFTATPGTGDRQICFDSGLASFSRGASEGHIIASPTEATETDTFSLASDMTAHADIPLLHCTSETMPMTGISSRASAVTSPSQITDIGVMAYASWYEPLLMNNDRYVRNSSGIYQSDDIRYWVDDAGATVDFYAFSPYNPDGLVLPSTKASTVLTYTAPQTASAQTDLLMAVNKGIAGNYNQAVDLSFKHLLTGVRVRFSEIPAGWNLKEVKFEGVHRNGSLDFAADSPAWTYSDNADQTISQANPTTETLFMTLPQAATSEQPVTFTVVANDGTTDRTYTRQLPSANWTMGTITTYTVSVTNFNFEIEQTVPLDAHYIICNTTLKAENIQSGRNWTVTVSSNDNADLTLQHTSDTNEFVKQGFWTDKEMTNGTTITNVSARGSNTITCSGSGDFPITVFVPENTGNAAREITLTIKVDGKSSPEAGLKLTQLCPIWNGNTGWEQINDNQSGVFGFYYTAKRVYVYNDGDWHNIANQIKTNVDLLINQYSASAYAKCVLYRVVAKYRNYVEIDYSKLNQLGTNAQSTIDGNTNTRQLFLLGGTALSNNFENALLEMKRINDSSTKAYVRRRSSDPSDVPQEIEGNLINESQMLTDVLKKNRYYLNTSTVGNLTTTTALIRAEDIVWYIPAVDQFANAPAWLGGEVMTAGSYWSSTAGAAETAYTGGNAEASRTETKLIRVARNRP